MIRERLALSSFSYSDFIKLVPKETEKFIKNLLDLIDYYGDDSIYINNTKYDRTANKKMILILSALSNIDTYKNVLSKNKFRFDRARIVSKDRKVNYEKLFAENFRLFDIYIDPTMYNSLTPLDIFFQTKGMQGGDGYASVLADLFSDSHSRDITLSLRTFNEKIKTEQAHRTT